VSGTGERTIEVARMRFRFRGAADAMQVVEHRYGAFLVAPGGPAPVSEIAVELDRPAAAPTGWTDGAVDVTEDRGGVSLAGEGLSAAIEPGGTRAAITASGPAPIDVLVRFLLASHLSGRRGLLAHASAVERDGRAWIFPGPSGVGKTTIATHLPGRVVCDEAVALVVGDDGHVRVHATPYWRASPRCVPAAGLVFPRRGPEPAWCDLSPARATARLVSQTGPLLDPVRPLTLKTAADIARALPAAEVTLSALGEIRSWLEPHL
jgi:hypothetical protein